MPSFDISSEVDLQELDNAINTAKREIENRYDFRGTDSSIEFDRKAQIIKLKSNSEDKIDALIDILQSKSHKRGIDISSFDVGKKEPTTGMNLKCEVKLKQGIDKDNGKKITKFIKDLKMKVQASIQDDKIRVTGKKRDDLQNAIEALKGNRFDVPLQFGNFRD